MAIPNSTLIAGMHEQIGIRQILVSHQSLSLHDRSRLLCQNRISHGVIAWFPRQAMHNFLSAAAWFTRRAVDKLTMLLGLHNGQRGAVVPSPLLSTWFMRRVLEQVWSTMVA